MATDTDTASDTDSTGNYYDSATPDEPIMTTGDEDITDKIDGNNATPDNVTGVLVDDNSLPETAYGLENGCVLLTIKKEYLQTLSDGEHKLTVEFTDGTYETTFIKESAAPLGVCGDIDGDGSVTAGDALSVLRYSAGIFDENKVGKPIAS